MIFLTQRHEILAPTAGSFSTHLKKMGSPSCPYAKRAFERKGGYWHPLTKPQAPIKIVQPHPRIPSTSWDLPSTAYQQTRHPLRSTPHPLPPQEAFAILHVRQGQRDRASHAYREAVRPPWDGAWAVGLILWSSGEG